MAVTIRQWRNLEGFEPLLATAMGSTTKTFADFKLLDAADYQHLTVAHTATPPNSGEPRPLGGGVTNLAFDSIDPMANEIIENDRHATSYVKDRNSAEFLVPDSVPGLWTIGRNGAKFGPLPSRHIPIHMDVAADLVVAAESAGSPRRVTSIEFWRLSTSKKLSKLGLPPGYGQGSFTWQSALMPGGVLLASFMSSDGAASQDYRLWYGKAGQDSWRDVGPFKLHGASNSGRVLFLRKGPPGALDLLVWPSAP